MKIRVRVSLARGTYIFLFINKYSVLNMVCKKRQLIGYHRKIYAYITAVTE